MLTDLADADLHGTADLDTSSDPQNEECDHLSGHSYSSLDEKQSISHIQPMPANHADTESLATADFDTSSDPRLDERPDHLPGQSPLSLAETAAREPAGLLTLPTEVVQMISTHLEATGDQMTLLDTCKNMRDKLHGYVQSTAPVLCGLSLIPLPRDEFQVRPDAIGLFQRWSDDHGASPDTEVLSHIPRYLHFVSDIASPGKKHEGETSQSQMDHETDTASCSWSTERFKQARTACDARALLWLRSKAAHPEDPTKGVQEWCFWPGRQRPPPSSSFVDFVKTNIYGKRKIMRCGTDCRLGSEIHRNASLRGRPFTITLPDNMEVRPRAGDLPISPVSMTDTYTINGSRPSTMMYWIPPIDVKSAACPVSSHLNAYPIIEPGSCEFPVSQDFKTRLILRPPGLQSRAASASVASSIGKHSYDNQNVTTVAEVETMTRHLALWQAHINVEASSKGPKAPSTEIALYDVDGAKTLQKTIQQAWKAQIGKSAAADTALLPHACRPVENQLSVRILEEAEARGVPLHPPRR